MSNLLKQIQNTNSKSQSKGPSSNANPQARSSKAKSKNQKGTSNAGTGNVNPTSNNKQSGKRPTNNPKSQSSNNNAKSRSASSNVQSQSVQNSVKYYLINGKKFSESDLLKGVTIGRENSDVLISHLRVSRRHAILRLVNGKLYIEDLRSTNGVYVDGKRINGRQEITPNSQIDLASVVDLSVKEVYATSSQHSASSKSQSGSPSSNIKTSNKGNLNYVYDKKHVKVLQNSKRIFAMGDVHGDYDGLIQHLYSSGVIDKDGNLIISKGEVLVFAGDYVDRGEKNVEVLKFISNLKMQAKARGAEVITLMGNHDYIFNRLFEAIKSGQVNNIKDAEKFIRYTAALQRFNHFAINDAVKTLSDLFSYYKSSGNSWAKSVKKMEKDGILQFFLNLPQMAIVDNNVFVHGSIPQEVMNKKNLDEINSMYDNMVESGRMSDAYLYVGSWTNGGYLEGEMKKAREKLYSIVGSEFGLKPNRLFVGHEPQIQISNYDDVVAIDGGLTPYYRKRGTEPGIVEINNREIKVYQPLIGMYRIIDDNRPTLVNIKSNSAALVTHISTEALKKSNIATVIKSNNNQINEDSDKVKKSVEDINRDNYMNDINLDGATVRVVEADFKDSDDLITAEKVDGEWIIKVDKAKLEDRLNNMDEDLIDSYVKTLFAHELGEILAAKHGISKTKYASEKENRHLYASKIAKNVLKGIDKDNYNVINNLVNQEVKMKEYLDEGKIELHDGVLYWIHLSGGREVRMPVTIIGNKYYIGKEYNEGSAINEKLGSYLVKKFNAGEPLNYIVKDFNGKKYLFSEFIFDGKRIDYSSSRDISKYKDKMRLSLIPTLLASPVYFDEKSGIGIYSLDRNTGNYIVKDDKLYPIDFTGSLTDGLSAHPFDALKQLFDLGIIDLDKGKEQFNKDLDIYDKISRDEYESILRGIVNELPKQEGFDEEDYIKRKLKQFDDLPKFIDELVSYIPTYRKYLQMNNYYLNHNYYDSLKLSYELLNEKKNIPYRILKEAEDNLLYIVIDIIEKSNDNEIRDIIDILGIKKTLSEVKSNPYIIDLTNKNLGELLTNKKFVKLIESFSANNAPSNIVNTVQEESKRTKESIFSEKFGSKWLLDYDNYNKKMLNTFLENLKMVSNNPELIIDLDNDARNKLDAKYFEIYMKESNKMKRPKLNSVKGPLSYNKDSLSLLDKLEKDIDVGSLKSIVEDEKSDYVLRLSALRHLANLGEISHVESKYKEFKGDVLSILSEHNAIYSLLRLYLKDERIADSIAEVISNYDANKIHSALKELKDKKIFDSLVLRLGRKYGVGEILNLYADNDNMFRRIISTYIRNKIRKNTYDELVNLFLNENDDYRKMLIASALVSKSVPKGSHSILNYLMDDKISYMLALSLKRSEGNYESPEFIRNLLLIGRSSYFKDKTRDFSKGEAFSVLQSMLRMIKDRGITNENIKKYLDRILAIRNYLKNKVIIGKEHRAIVLSNDEIRNGYRVFNNKNIISNLKNYGVKKINSYMGKGKEKALKLLSKKGKVVFWFNGHGHDTSLSISDDIDINIGELADALLERQRKGYKISDVTLFLDACNSYDFSLNLYPALKLRGAETYPLIVTSTNRDQYGYTSLDNGVPYSKFTLNLEKNGELTFGDVFKLRIPLVY